MSTADRPCPRALLVQAREMDDAWDAMTEHEDQTRAEQAILALRQVLAGTRRLYSRTDYRGLRVRCACSWGGVSFRTARQLQSDDGEFARHICYLAAEEKS